MKYKFKRNKDEEGYFIIEDGHIMFPEDVIKRLKRITYLESNTDAQLLKIALTVLLDRTLKILQSKPVRDMDEVINNCEVLLEKMI